MQQIRTKLIRAGASFTGSIKRMIGVYIDNCIYIVATIFLADTSVRAFRMLREYIAYSKHYLPERRLLQILRRVFSYSIPSTVLLVLTIIAALLRSRNNAYFAVALPGYLVYVPLYWIYCAVGFGRSTIDYAYLIRENHGLDYAAGMASNYFHGYLNLVMPSFDDHLGIRERIALYEAQNRVRFALNRLVILVPNTMFTNSKIESRILEKAKPLEIVMKNRAGVNRPFATDVYRFTEPINGTFYYVAMEGATPLLSFFDSMNFQLSATWHMKEMQREILFKFYRHLKMLLREWPKTHQEVELVLYNVYKDNGQAQDVGEVLRAHIINLWEEGKP